MPQKQPVRIRAQKIVTAVIGLLAIIITTLIAAELMARGYYFIETRRLASAAEMYAYQRNSFVSDLTKEECRYVDTLYPHPYLAHVHSTDRSCGIWGNKLGLLGPDYPLERDPSTFSVLLVGGSVAAQHGLFLEEELNQCYVPPSGDKFAIFNGGDGGWKQPQQAILTLLYGDAFDALVSLEGFNDMSYLISARLEKPSSNFVAINPFVTGSYAGVAATWLGSRTMTFFKRHWLFGRSMAAYLVADAVRSTLQGVVAESEKKTQLDTAFALPAEWDAERAYRFNVGQYRKYIRAIADMMAPRKAAFFLQPVPSLAKTLTAEERAVSGNLSYGELYQRMTDDLVALRSEGVDVFSLLDVFASEAGTIYADDIHFVRRGFESRGNRIVAKEIARRIAKVWQIERRPDCPPSVTAGAGSP